MPQAPIALIARNPNAVLNWQTKLSAAMPNETIIAFAALSQAQKAAVEIAIVADPDPAEVAALPNLQWIHSLWAGVERLVAELGAAAKPIVRLVDPELARTMAEAVLAWTYYLQRDMPAYRAQQTTLEWRQRTYRPPSTMTIGILGYGALGSRAAERLNQAGFTVCGWSRSPKAADAHAQLYSGDDGLTAMLAQSDIVVCLLPLTVETRGLINSTFLAEMKRGASLINFGRGAVIVPEALIAALEAGRLSHAVLDVFATEPLETASPFWTHPSVTVLPHISAPTNFDTASVIVAGNIKAYRDTGALPKTVDVVKGY
jgi:glyoxylate/hydroxypyruvate reductase